MKFDPNNFPHLREFARGYLHQDVLREYGSAENAANAYWADLNQEERKELAVEAGEFEALVKEWSLHKINAALRLLGSAWRAPSNLELESVLKLLILGFPGIDKR